jgi:hypothetical protein
VLAVVQARNDDLEAGLGPCVAEMLAAQRFNGREGTGGGAAYGVVTTGSNWKFLKLSGTQVWIDRPEYYVDRVEKILGILVSMLGA